MTNKLIRWLRKESGVYAAFAHIDAMQKSINNHEKRIIELESKLSKIEGQLKIIGVPNDTRE